MIKTWAQWKFGIAGARKAMWGKTVSKTGTLFCRHCDTGGHSHLFDGGRCKDCFVPKKINSRYIAKKRLIKIQSRDLLPATRQLIGICTDIMLRRNVTAVALADLLGVPKSSFMDWINGNLAESGQQSNNERVLAGLRRLDKGEVAA